MPGYPDDSDQEFITCTIAPFWNSCHFHKEESAQVICVWLELASVQNMSWKHACETSLGTAPNLELILPVET